MDPLSDGGRRFSGGSASRDNAGARQDRLGNTHVKIRSLIPTDVDSVRTLFVEGQLSVTEGSPSHMRRATERYVRQTLADDLADAWGHYMGCPGSHFWVAEMGGHVEGIVGVEPGHRGAAEIRRLAVSLHARRRGIARGLLLATEAWARTRGYTAMELTTTHLQSAARALYESAGYLPEGTGTWGPLNLTHMRKQLADSADRDWRGAT